MRVATDVGWTFTDLVYFDTDSASGRVTAVRTAWLVLCHLLTLEDRKTGAQADPGMSTLIRVHWYRWAC